MTSYLYLNEHQPDLLSVPEGDGSVPVLVCLLHHCLEAEVCLRGSELLHHNLQLSQGDGAATGDIVPGYSYVQDTMYLITVVQLSTGYIVPGYSCTVMYRIYCT